jgi:transcriptional regulator with GAF, ATPase, and Fis domain
MKDPDGNVVGALMSFRDLTRERALAKRVGEIEQFSGIIGRDEKMLDVFDLITDLADSNVPVFVQGESGTGKELVAAAIHNEGPRANHLFVPVNCGALPESLLESELFGHVKGAFTGAIRDKKGRFELADGGTIFLDEIGDISPSMQVKLLRVLQEGRFERVGSESTIAVDVRIISATNKDIHEEIISGTFREDLYYRLSVVPVTLPPLRDRRNDIPLLVEHTMRRIAKVAGKEGVTVSAEALDIMMSYDWPGNVRELQNWLQFALVKCRKETVILPEHLPPTAHIGGVRPKRRRRRRKLSIEVVRGALRNVNGNKVEAARELGVSRATLYRFLNDTGLLD